ncbi:uncharacterized protein MYCFIDRAFT_160371 [Pseudocercospora fijiensis CIRAD86]|uniref:Uncharacterized protein n=1 Tax=Pseudocercospora fijiensis (strain CIRAD86) TaxID=383855 RepID=N1Q8I5_PSEFD|nr:uncharacterized protein MYCFIDRAFT_160371 [Pseudocercospora fijiensis CIRAD86]EME89179.1 hypothetical protein MYCFIDRAFT_160371 [Pseudocercospora fijiensis CIRAD86]
MLCHGAGEAVWIRRAIGSESSRLCIGAFHTDMRSSVMGNGSSHSSVGAVCIARLDIPVVRSTRHPVRYVSIRSSIGPITIAHLSVCIVRCANSLHVIDSDVHSQRSSHVSDLLESSLDLGQVHPMNLIVRQCSFETDSVIRELCLFSLLLSSDFLYALSQRHKTSHHALELGGLVLSLSAIMCFF